MDNKFIAKISIVAPKRRHPVQAAEPAFQAIRCVSQIPRDFLVEHVIPRSHSLRKKFVEVLLAKIDERRLKVGNDGFESFVIIDDGARFIIEFHHDADGRLERATFEDIKRFGLLRRCREPRPAFDAALDKISRNTLAAEASRFDRVIHELFTVPLGVQTARHADIVNGFGSRAFAGTRDAFDQQKFHVPRFT